jgi:hypothetical protein
MNTVHPTIAAALAPFAPQLQFLEQPPFKPTKRPTPTQTFNYSLNDIELVCELDWEREEKQTYDDPGCRANATLCEAVHRGEDILCLLSDEQIEEIEIAFLEQDES